MELDQPAIELVSAENRVEDGVVTPLPLGARGISGNGEVVFGELADGSPAFSRNGGPVQSITLPPDALPPAPTLPSDPMSVLASSFAGDVLIGRYRGEAGLRKLFLWEDGVTRDLGAANPLNPTGPAMSDDGSLIVDGDTLWLDLERQLLRSFLSDLGIDLSEWSLLSATDDSPDGRLPEREESR